MKRDYISRNEHSRGQLHALLNRLTSENFDSELGDGWTVGTALAHLAFWDRYATTVIQRWERNGFRYDAGFTGDPVNNAALRGWRALPRGFVRAEVILAAEESDRRAAAVSAALADEATTGGMPAVSAGPSDTAPTIKNAPDSGGTSL